MTAGEDVVGTWPGRVGQVRVMITFDSLLIIGGVAIAVPLNPRR